MMKGLVPALVVMSPLIFVQLFFLLRSEYKCRKDKKRAEDDRKKSAEFLESVKIE